MDSVAALFDGPRARGAFLIRSTVSPPWCIRVEDEAPLTLMSVVRGAAWVLHDDGTEVQLHQNDIAIAHGPAHYTVADDPATTAQVIILPGQLCATPDGLVTAMQNIGKRNWGNTSEGSTSC
jgi:hypothetical protein